MVLPSIQLLKPEIVNAPLIYFYVSPPVSFFIVVQSLSHVWLCVTLWTKTCQVSLTFTISQSLLKFMSIESVILSNHLILCHSLLLSPSIFPSIREKDSFPKSRVFTSGGQSIEASASASVLPKNSQGWCPLGLTGLISLQSKGLSRVFSSNAIWNHQFFSVQPSLWSKSHIYTYHPKSYYLYLNVSRICPLCSITHWQHIHWSHHSLYHRILLWSPAHLPPSISSCSQ